MKRFLGIIAVMMAVVGLSTSAQAQRVLTYTRAIGGLDGEGFLIPGTAQLTVTLNVDSSIVGPDFDENSGVNIFQAIGFTETVPTGWTYGGLVAGDNNPDIRPANNATGDLGFAWITPPPTPFSFTYRVNLPVDETGPVSITGEADYRTNGGSIFADAGSTLVEVKPTVVTQSRVLSGAGITGDSGQYYVPGQQIIITVTLEKDGDEVVQALGYEDTTPNGWTYGGLVAGDFNPDVRPANNATGLLGFGWITPPDFPFTFAYRVNVPANEEDVNQTFTSRGKYRFGGGEILTNQIVDTLNPAPCTTIGLAGEGGNFYSAGVQKNIVVTVDSTCTSTIQALGVNSVIPAGWSYGGLVAGDNNPDIRPANNATGTLGFAWISPPATPFTFTFRANVPANETGDKDITGQVEYRLSGDALFSDLTTLTLSGADLTPPVITLTGDAAVTVECGGAYTDAGATASDDRDGDITGDIVVGGDTVDTATPGDYTITYDVSDAAANAATQVTRTVTVSDTTDPVITLTGNATVTIQCGGVYTDAGATVADECDTGVTVVTGGSVDTTTVGDYTITYDATDASGNAATQVTRTVTVADTTAPVITRLGAASVNVQCGSVYVDAGATASDTCDGDLSGSIVAVNPVNTAITGVYVITFNVSDGANNAAAQVTRTVNVVDTTAPVVTLTGAASVTVECTGTYNDQGATAADVCDNSVSVTSDAATAVNEGVPGSYTVTYSATDDSGNTGTATRTVVVADTTDPVITLTGNATETVECGGSYTDAGATVADGCDANVSVDTAGDTVDTSNPGTYVITYDATDASGNAAAQVTRTVTVSDTTIPVITLLGSANVTVECGSAYTDAGATAVDACDGNITGSIDTNSDVDTATPGTYSVTYDAQDSSNNAAVQVVRTVVVSDTTAPVLTLNGDASVTVECGGTYTDAGAGATDSCDGDLTNSVVVGGDTVDVTSPGTYTVTYSVADSAGNTDEEVRTVIVSDTTDPVITLTGDATVTIACGSSYTDAGATADDACDAAVQVDVDSSSVNPAVAGTYTVTITATDASGNSATATRSVVVEDTVLPVVTLFGDAAVTINCQGTYTEAGASATDACDGDLSVVTSGQVVTGTPGDYVLTYTATDASGNVGTATRTVTVLNNCPVEGEGEEGEGEGTVDECADDDANGIADDIFSCLDTDGESLTLDVNGGTCTRRVYAVTWFGDAEGQDPAAVVANPNDENQVVTVSVPRGVIGAGQQAILVVSIACSLEDLLGDEAFNLGTTPDGEVAGNAWFDVTIIVSEDGGTIYEKLDNSILAANPVSITINGLNATDGGTAGLQSYSTTIQPGDDGAQIFALVDTWSDDGVSSTYADGTITADATELSVFGAFEQLPAGPELQVSPNPASEFIVGITRPQESVNNTIKVKNVGGGSLSGLATINDPNGVFTLVGDATYVLGAGAEDTVTVRFAPAGKKGNFTATLTLTNSAGDPVTVTLKATSAPFIKNIAILGCGPEGTAGHPAADLAVALLALGALVLSSRAFRRAKQS